VVFLICVYLRASAAKRFFLDSVNKEYLAADDDRDQEKVTRQGALRAGEFP
jgi:hypothetical protein